MGTERSIPGPPVSDEVSSFRILERVAEGGFNVVYRTFKERSDLAVALKVLSVDAVDASAMRRFEREIRIAGLHQNVVPEAVDGQPPTSTPRTDAARNDSLAKDEAVIAAKTAADAHGYGPTGLRVTQTDQDDTIG